LAVTLRRDRLLWLTHTLPPFGVGVVRVSAIKIGTHNWLVGSRALSPYLRTRIIGAYPTDDLAASPRRSTRYLRKSDLTACPGRLASLTCDVAAGVADAKIWVYPAG
jgi:hypothetical protein